MIFHQIDGDSHFAGHRRFEGTLERIGTESVDCGNRGGAKCAGGHRDNRDRYNDFEEAVTALDITHITVSALARLKEDEAAEGAGAAAR